MSIDWPQLGKAVATVTGLTVGSSLVLTSAYNGAKVWLAGRPFSENFWVRAGVGAAAGGTASGFLIFPPAATPGVGFGDLGLGILGVIAIPVGNVIGVAATDLFD